MAVGSPLSVAAQVWRGRQHRNAAPLAGRRVFQHLGGVEVKQKAPQLRGYLTLAEGRARPGETPPNELAIESAELSRRASGGLVGACELLFVSVHPGRGVSKGHGTGDTIPLDMAAAEL